MLLPASKQLIFITFCTWHLLFCVIGTFGRHNERISRNHAALPRSSSINIKDKIIEVQCHAKCEHFTSPMFQTCREKCKKDLIKEKRRGQCPSINKVNYQNISMWEKLSCLDNCSCDYDCPEIQKCCQSACGPVCTSPLGIIDDINLPPIPKILHCKLPRGNRVEISIQTWSNSSYYCHVEMRYLIGLEFSPRKLSPWHWQHVEKTFETYDASFKSKITNVAFNLKAGRWYQVRVAAINDYGFRGYSEPSKPFKTLTHPKPPKAPADLKIASSYFDGKRYSIKVAWCHSRSSIPIEKYKIIWTLYIPSMQESLLTNESYVKDAHQFEISKLKPDSSYYIQVQAMSINGDQRLKSEKKSILFNTTSSFPSNIPLNCTPRHRYKKKYIVPVSNKIISTNIGKNTYNELNQLWYQNEVGVIESPETDSLIKNNYVADTTNKVLNSTSKTNPYEVRFRLNRKLGMIVQLSGFKPYKEKVYELCPIDTNCEEREYSAIRVKKDSLEFSKLKFDTTYIIRAYNNNNAGSFTFTTPKCENFRKKFPKIQIMC